MQTDPPSFKTLTMFCFPGRAASKQQNGVQVRYFGRTGKLLMFACQPRILHQEFVLGRMKARWLCIEGCTPLCPQHIM